MWWWEGRIRWDELARALLTFLIGLFAIIWYAWRYVNSRKKPPLLPPGPRGLPLIGSLPFLGPNLHQCLAELARRYGPIMKLQLGTKLCVVISSSSVAKEIYKENDIIFSNHDLPIAARIISYGGSNLVRCPYGPTWRAMRRVFNQDLLSNKNLDVSKDLRQKQIQKMVSELHSNAGNSVNVGEIAFATSLNLLESMLWGDRLKCEAIEGDFQQLVMETIKLLTRPNISDFFPFVAWFDVRGIERRMRKCISRLDKIYEAIIERRMNLDGVDDGKAEDATGGKDFLSILINVMKDDDPKKPITCTNIKALITDIMVGGTSTIATTVEWAMAELIHKPEIKNKVQEELKAVVGAESRVDESHIPRLSYLQAVLKETLRLHAVVPLLVPRVPSQSCVVGGYSIPKVAQVMTNVWAIQRDPAVWDNPLEFRPERFLGNVILINDFSFFPFGSGRRKCAGLPLVERLLPLIVATLLHMFEWRVPDSEKLDLREKFGVTLTKANPLVAIALPRFLPPWRCTND
ncbi:hypothetical protein J5N97_030141 [Dioscorea zingiberensis]|uniref:Cytochrome P450 n=1 Tax=Dioscorea zingiberensis TaxID=325984 RepID=A0A9D5H3V1_9LILI|nr:hypothetical protein J5N97_030141 [Dioscorea zingiberensis]